ncbi:MAG: hypothetical protein KJ709_04120 [Nanoarchaeota archaeon]|nr:hypothetical protein [Nanoarchaeota archaeon]
MAKKSKKSKKKPKKISAKKEKYAKFKKDKPSTINATMPDLTPEQQAQKKMDEEKIARFMRFGRIFKKDDKKGGRKGNKK